MHGDGDPIGEQDEELDRRRDLRRVPRWTVAALVALVVAGAAIVVIGRSDDGSLATPSSPASRTSERRPPPPTLSIPDQSAVAATGDGRFVYLSGDTLTLIDPFGRVVTQHRYPTRTVSTAPRAVRLVVDGASGTLWSVSVGGPRPGYVERFTYPDLNPVAHVALTAVASDATVLDGSLNVLTTKGVFQLAPGTLRPLGNGSGIVYLTADAGLAQLLINRVPGGLQPLAFGDDPMAGPVLRLSRVPRFAVVDRALYAIGTRDARAWVARLDPRTLRFGSNLARSGSGTTAGLAGIGDHSVFIRTGSGVDCLDTTSQRVVESYPHVTGPVAATRHRALTTTRSGAVRTLPLRSCLG